VARLNLVALARAMLYDPRWGVACGGPNSVGSVDAPPQYWRAPPHGHEEPVRQYRSRRALTRMRSSNYRAGASGAARG